MPVDRKTVTGRRKLRFDSFDAMLWDAEQLVASPGVRTLGNWPLGNLLTHLAAAMNLSVEGIPFKAAWYIRLLGPRIKRRVLAKGMSPGFNLPRSRDRGAFPESASPQVALESLRAAVSRVQREQMTATHPVFGRLTHDEWTQLHLRHAELHLSFAVPAEVSTAV